MRLSVVIATRDRAGFLARALDSLAAQRAAPPFEVIVADNGSRDGTARVVAERTSTLALRRVFVPEPNRGAARNAALGVAAGEIAVFVDDDVWLPSGFLSAHSGAHPEGSRLAVSGPILNVASYTERPAPRPANFSNAFLCTCNASVRRSDLAAAGGFDERFNLYGWEDTELGLRLRRGGVRRAFAWDAYLYHVKPPESETLEVLAQKAAERAQMATRLLAKERGMRAKLATGAYGPNLWRARFLPPAALAPLYRRMAQSARLPAPLRAAGRAAYLDVVYTGALRRALRGGTH